MTRDIEDPARGFAEGTEIATPDGLRPVETLRPGDRVIAHDRGARRLTGVVCLGETATVRIPQGALGNDAELRVAPGQAILRSGWQVELLFGTDQVLAAAADLAGLNGIGGAGRGRLWRLTLGGADMVLAGGVWAASQDQDAPRALLSADEARVLASYGLDGRRHAAPDPAALRLVA